MLLIEAQNQVNKSLYEKLVLIFNKKYEKKSGKYAFTTTIRKLALYKKCYPKEFQDSPIAYLLDKELSKLPEYNELIENAEVKKLW
jgi:hypothetical protein